MCIKNCNSIQFSSIQLNSCADRWKVCAHKIHPDRLKGKFALFGCAFSLFWDVINWDASHRVASYCRCTISISTYNTYMMEYLVCWNASNVRFVGYVKHISSSSITKTNRTFYCDSSIWNWDRILTHTRFTQHWLHVFEYTSNILCTLVYLYCVCTFNNNSTYNITAYLCLHSVFSILSLAVWVHFSMNNLLENDFAKLPKP